MVSYDDYAIWQEPNKNRIVISLPQTWATVNVTTSAVTERRLYLTDEEEAVILGIVKRMYEEKLYE